MLWADFSFSGEKSSKTHAVASDGDFWITKVISTISQLEEDKKHVTLLENVEEEEQVLHVKAKETVESLRKVRSRGKKRFPDVER